MSAFEPKQFGKYFLLEKKAVGGMAEIYKAKTYGVDGFEKLLAIKRILPHCSADKDFITMLIDEAKLSVLLSHANIVQVYDLGKVGDDYYISMEFINGVNLRDILYRSRENKKPLPVDIAVYITSEMCKGLDYAHRKTDHNNRPLGIVHRDVSPQNILISYEGEVKIVDFGIAKAAMNISHTMAGILKGKIAYMSPEQAMGKRIDRKTDIFSAGILLYEMLTGTRLFTGESQFEVLKKIRETIVTEESLPDVIPAALKPIVAKALAYNPEERFQNAGDLQLELTKYLYSTHIDFSPRKLSQFIDTMFAEELRSEQEETARELAAIEMTGSVNAKEGWKQMDIVHRPESAEQTDKREIQDANTIASSITSGKGKPSERKTSPSVKVEKPRKSSSRFISTIAVLAAIGAIGFAAVKFIPKFMSPTKPAEQTQVAERFGSVNVTSEPTDASIFLDGKNTGRKTPSVLEELSIGKSYAIRVEKENYGPAEKPVNVVSGERISLNLTLAAPSGVINIITDPPGAAVLLNGRLTGLSSPTVLENIPIGVDQRITLTKPGYEDFEQLLNVSSTKPQRISSKLKPLTPNAGSIAANSNPPGATILIDGKDTGRKTPATIPNLATAKYPVTLRLDGFDDYSESVEVKEDSTAKIEATLQKKEEKIAAVKKEEAAKATLKITSNPSDATITLDGRPTGKRTPASIDNLKSGGTYRIKLDKKGYKSVVRKKSIQGESDTLSVELEVVAEKTPEVTPPVTTPPVTPPPVQAPVQQPPPQAQPTVTQGTGSGPATIKISSSPSGADVFVNSEYKGTTPLSATVQPGNVQVLVHKEGLAKYSRSVSARAGETINLTGIKLGELFGEVSLNSTPPRAQVIFDGQAIPAKTPVTVRKVRTDQSHSVSIELPGYKTWSRSFSMEGENAKSFNVVLEPQ